MLQKDGKCDDGSLTEDGQVWCDLGTDCTDCGAWTLKVPESQAKQTLAKPIQMLRDRQVCCLCQICGAGPVIPPAVLSPPVRESQTHCVILNCTAAYEGHYQYTAICKVYLD